VNLVQQVDIVSEGWAPRSGAAVDDAGVDESTACGPGGVALLTPVRVAVTGMERTAGVDLDGDSVFGQNHIGRQQQRPPGFRHSSTPDS
jgi:hypothetical protein